MKRILLLSLFFMAAFQLFAQKVDTIYVYETKIEYDTIVVYDTLWVYDTLHLQNQDAADSDVSLATDPAMKTKKTWRRHDLFGQRKERKKNHNLQDEFFDGLHFGYLAEVEWAQPNIFTDYANNKYTNNLGKCGWQAGLELSYNFAKYFGVSAALNYGYLGSPVYNEFYEGLLEKNIKKTSYGLSMPVKFEFHCPIAPNVWFAVDAGARLRAPFRTFTEGFKGFSPDHDYYYEYEDFSGMNVDNMDMANIYEYSKDAPVFNVDLLLDAGFYFKLPNSDLMRASVGLNYALHKYAMGSYYNYDEPGLGYSYNEGIFYSKNNHVALQLAYIHTFQNHKIKMHAQPNWNDGKLLSRHEFRLEFSDPSTFTTQFVLPFERHNFEMSNGYEIPVHQSTPIFAFNYHYRAAKWFWVGLSVNYNHFSLIEKHLPSCSNHFNAVCLMPDVRFSYLNRPHCTLYSAAALGLSFVSYEDRIQLTLGSDYEDGLALLPTFHLTAFGVKAGAKHWFGSAEIGYGFKGFASVGVGYEF